MAAVSMAACGGKARAKGAISTSRLGVTGVLAATVFALTLACFPARGALSVIPPTGNPPPDATPLMPPLDSWEEIAVELRAAQLSRTTVIAYEHEGAVLVPASSTLDLLELSSTIDRNRELRAKLERSDLVISLSNSIVCAGQDTIRIEPGLVQWRDGDLFVEAEMLGRILEVQSYIDLGELTVTFDSLYDLPIGRRWLREQKRMAAGLGGPGREPDLSLGLERPFWRGALLDWAISTPDPSDLQKSSASLIFGGSLWGGGLDARYRGTFDDPNLREFDIAWTGVWPDSKRFRQLRLGRTQSTAPRARPMRGFVLSNSPFIRSRDFGQSVVRGYLEPGWEVEVYNGGTLIGYQRADERGYYEFELPVGYGQNSVEIRGYGPNGESKVLERALRVDFDRIPDSTTEYGISAGQCVTDDCEGLFNLDLRHGLHRDWTVRLGAESFTRDVAEDLYHPYFAMIGNVARGWQLRLETAWRAAQAVRLGYEPSLNLRADVSHERYDRLVEDPILTPNGEYDRSQLQLFWRPVSRMQALFLRGDVVRRSGVSGRRWRSTLGLNHTVGRVRFFSDWIEEWTEDAYPFGRGTRWTLFANSVLNARWFKPLHGVYVRAGVEMDLSVEERDLASVRLGRRLGRSSRIEVGAEWLRGDDAPLFTLTVTSTGSHAHASAYVSRSTRGDYSNLIQAEGSVLYNSSTGRIESNSFRSLGRGGIQGVVFVDANANGVFDRDERGVPNARLVVGGEFAETDEYGRYAVWHLVPYESASVELELASLRDPLLMPDFEVAAAAVLPNGFREFDVPLVPGLELTGSVMLEGDHGRLVLGGVPLRFIGLDRAHRHEVRTYSDGEFYVLPVAPGRYQVRIDAGYLERTGFHWRGGPQEILVPAAEDAETFDVQIVLHGSPDP